MNNLPIIFLIILFSITSNQAQVIETKNWCLSICDLAGDEKRNTELLHLQMRNNTIKNKNVLEDIIRFPLRIGIVQNDTVKIELDEVILLRAIENLNKAFSQARVEFYIERVDVIISQLHMEQLSANRYQPYNIFSEKYDVKDMISLYIFDHKNEFCERKDATVSCGRTGGFAYILSELTNNIVMSKFDLADQKIVAHEFGHFFGLYHTFESYQFGKDNFKTEDCDKVGDRICDTPPDPGDIFEVYVNYSNCEMVGFKDENGNEFKPLIENYMSYYKPCYLREYSFTMGQIDVIHMAAKSDFRYKYSR